MTTKRLCLLLCALLAGLGCVFLLPSKTEIGPAGITLNLPREFGIWSSKELPVTTKELEGLAPDTGFARRLYENAFGDQIAVGIVLSGEDMTNSIHRPERCLPAQGWTVAHSERVRVPIAGAQPLEVTKLTNVAERRLDDGRAITVRNLSYYWFIGYKDITASHWTRTFIDVKDRILHGENQRWAYVTVAATVTENFTKFGRNEKKTSELIEGMIADIVPQFKRPEQKVAAR